MNKVQLGDLSHFQGVYPDFVDLKDVAQVEDLEDL